VIKYKHSRPRNKRAMYKEYIKEMSCLVCGSNTVDPHHLDQKGLGGSKDKTKDYSCIPLCRAHHTEYHAYGLTKFEKLYQINLWKNAHKLLRRWFAPRENKVF